MIEALTLIREVGSLGVVVILVMLAAQNIKEQRDAYLQSTAEHIRLLERLFDAVEKLCGDN